MPTQETHDKVTEQIARYMYEQHKEQYGLFRDWESLHKESRANWLQTAKNARDAVAYTLLSGSREPR